MVYTSIVFAENNAYSVFAYWACVGQELDEQWGVCWLWHRWWRRLDVCWMCMFSIDDRRRFFLIGRVWDTTRKNNNFGRTVGATSAVQEHVPLSPCGVITCIYMYMSVEKFKNKNIIHT